MCVCVCARVRAHVYLCAGVHVGGGVSGPQRAGEGVRKQPEGRGGEEVMPLPRKQVPGISDALAFGFC